MQENINEKLSGILSGSKVKSEDIARFLNSKEGQKLKNSLSDGDKKEILKKFMQMDAGEVKKTLKNADLSGLSGMSCADILNKLKKG